MAKVAAPVSRMRSPARREQILDIAQPMFAARGFSGTSTREIAAAAGVSDALLYRHFDSKDDLLAAMVDRAISGFAELPPIEALRTVPFRPMLEQLGEVFVDRAIRNEEILIILLGEYRAVEDRRFVIFIDSAARSLGDLIASRVDRIEETEGYLLARSYFGSLISFVLLQRVLRMDDIHPIDTSSYVSASAAPLARYLEEA